MRTDRVDHLRYRPFLFYHAVCAPPWSGHFYGVSVPPPEGKRRIVNTLSGQEHEELQRLRALELRVRRVHELHAEIVALLGPPGGG